MDSLDITNKTILLIRNHSKKAFVSYQLKPKETKTGFPLMSSIWRISSNKNLASKMLERSKFYKYKIYA
ncbi:hypothetical protein TNIN_209533 [Trichonephila inaurata madagascariensis]|uniref:Uncharacterized protein n=1 Tax=Trichonephila inaurata madagascariensis TaxID=2747483 RepID=A0A8X6YGP7_9ARAC|nr:hypothetical protein TNIN_209533 [Trichonephila inaurata madagascariensis]